MKIVRYILLGCFGILATSASMFAQENNLEHHFVAGLNLGATAPLSMPAEVRSIDSYHPLLTPQIGYELRYRIKDSKWKIGSGVYFEVKGMSVTDRVKYMYTSVILDKEDSGKLSGYFVGKNRTKVQISYLTLPVYAIREINDKWSVRAGGFVSYAHSKKFSGSVSDGYMLPVDDETGEIGRKEDISHAKFDFGDDIRNFDFGALAGAEMKINRKLSIYGNFSWSFTPIFPSNYKAINFKMNSIYMALGVTHKL